MQLFTDTLDLRFEPSSATGKLWIGARGELGVAGLFASPWTDGAPDDTRALTAHYAGLELGGQLFFGPGLYAGIEVSARRWFFAGKDSTKIPVPVDRFVFLPAAVAGYWSRDLQGWARAALDLDGGAESPRLAAEVTYFPEDWSLAPHVELRAGWAQDSTEITKTRVGGLNPYVIPLAGAGWAEFRVADYAALRAGPSIKLDPIRLSAFFDAVLFDGKRTEYGVALQARGTLGRFYGQLTGGYAPDLQRKNGALRASLWALIGFDWTAF